MTASASSLVAAADWLMALLGGTIALSLCVIAVAVLGFSMLDGRMDFRRAGRLIVGLFLVLGAKSVASGLLGRANSPPNVEQPVALQLGEVEPQQPIQASSASDPYAGASLIGN